MELVGGWWGRGHLPVLVSEGDLGFAAPQPWCMVLCWLSGLTAGEAVVGMHRGLGWLCGEGPLPSKPFSLGGVPSLQDGVGEGQDRACSWCKSEVRLLHFPGRCRAGSALQWS